jgi:hypothetical protein
MRSFPISLIILVSASVVIVLWFVGCIGSERVSVNQDVAWHPSSVAWSPQGSFVAVELIQVQPTTEKHTASRIDVFSSDSGMLHLSTSIPALRPVWMDDYRLLIGIPGAPDGRGRMDLQLIDCRTKSETKVDLVHNAVRFPVVALSKDQVFTLSSNGEVSEVITISTGDRRLLKGLPKLYISTVAFNWTQKRLAIIEPLLSSIQIVSYPDLRLLKTFTTEYSNIESVFWAGSRYLLLIVREGSKLSLNRIDADTGQSVPLLSGKDFIGYLSVNAKGFCVIAYSDSNARERTSWGILNWQSGQIVCVLTSNVIGASVHPTADELFVVYKKDATGPLQYSFVAMKQILSQWCAEQ